MKFGYTYDVLKTTMYYLKLIARDIKDLDELMARLKYLEKLCLNSRNLNNAITLSTVHSAKGLEFDRVYLIDLVDGSFPTSSSIEQFNKGKYDPLEEERRLFYVGMSRAKNHLSLITISKIGDKMVDASRFVTDLEKNKRI